MPSHAPVTEEVPCRSCSSFAEYMKASKKKLSNELKVQAIAQPGKNCPLDREQLGTSSWGLLHTMASVYPVQPSKEQQKDMGQFFDLFAKFYPCDHCAKDLSEQLVRSPPQTESQEALSQWLCQIHNEVNERLGKPIFDCSKVNERWRDGWLDGSCG